LNTRLLFPIIDMNGDPVLSAAGIDGKYTSYDSSDHGADLPVLSSVHETIEVGNGIYRLDIQAAEINRDYTLIKVTSTIPNAKQ